jgi:CRP-like cAMP-binding protein
VEGGFTGSQAFELGEVLAERLKSSRCVSLRHFEEREVVYRQGDPAMGLFYILQGWARSFIYSQDGREKTLLILGKGDLLGAAPFYLESHYLDNTAAFDGPMTSYQIDREGFDCLLADYPGLAKFFLADMAWRVARLEQEIASQSFLDVRGRLQLALAQLAGRYGQVTQSGVRIDLHLTHEQLAQLVGANRATVSACLSQLQREGFYQVDDQHIVLAPWAAGQLLLP